MRDFIDDFAPLLFAIAAFGILSGLICWGSNSYGRYQCTQYEAVTGKQTKWVTLDECYVKTADGWQRWDEYKARATASEGLNAAP